MAALPQPLTHLIADTARGQGRVAHRPRSLSKLGLRQLAPTVLVSGSPPAAALTALRAAGYAPIAESAGERCASKSSCRTGAPLPSLPRTVTRAADKSAHASIYVPADRLLTAPPTAPEPDPFGSGMPFATDTEEIVAGYAKHVSHSDVHQVAHAIDTGAAITVEYVTTSRNRTVRTLRDLELDPPYLDASCHLREAEPVFALSRIHGVMPA
ncbi:hypothetical protein [Streptomyces sp. SYSU K217416]